MRARTLEIRWHDSKPISTCDFQPVPFKKARPANDKDLIGQSYRLATGGEDNNIRVWMVHPNILPPSVAESASTGSGPPPTPHPPRVEYLATLSRHSAPVNVVRFGPHGDLIASAGDDGMIIVWAPSTASQSAGYGLESNPDELQYEKEFWKARTVFRCTTMQVYDLAWSPTGEYIIAGSTDNTARVFTSSDGKCVRELAEHSHYVQGVAWDPLNEYIATQSSDRSVHVHSISTKHGTFETHAIGKNTRINVRHSRTPSSSARPSSRMIRRESVASDAESAVTTLSDLKDKEKEKDESLAINTVASGSQQPPSATPLTPATSIASTPSAAVFLPPPSERSMSRRSSFSSVAPNSPPQYSRYGRSPSPMPPLPAIRAPPSPASIISSRLYGDESFTNFFRRLTFSPDGGMLLTPAGQFEDQTVIPGNANSGRSSESSRGRKGHPVDGDPSSVSSVYIYTRANFARPPIAQLPGHKKASVAVKFSPVLYELRPEVIGPERTDAEVKPVVLERGKLFSVPANVAGPMVKAASNPTAQMSSSQKTDTIIAPTPQVARALPSPALSAADSMRPPTPAHAPTPSTSHTCSVFALPYRMIFAVATMDTITIHDTQQAGPIAMLTKLHYDEFTDMSWSSDGQCLMLASRDGYCTIVIFDEPLTPHHTQQFALQMQSIAQSHSISSIPPSHPPSSSTQLATPTATPSKRQAVVPDSSPDIREIPNPALTANTSASTAVSAPEPAKKKRRVALTHLGGLE